MRAMGWIVKFIVFVLLVGFAIKNTDPIVVRFYLGYEWHAPLVFVILVFFAAGALFGALSSLPYAFRYRREMRGLRRELENRSRTEPPTTERAAGPTATDFT